MYRTKAKALFAEFKPVWMIGDGRWASLAFCRGLSIVLVDSEEKALRQKAQIDATGCGGGCYKSHQVVDILNMDLDQVAACKILKRREVIRNGNDPDIQPQSDPDRRGREGSSNS